MPPAKVRFTIRRSMVLVAIVATLMGSGLAVKRLIDLRAAYRLRAAHHSRQEVLARLELTEMAPLKEAIQGELKGKDLPSRPPTSPEDEEDMKTDPELRQSVADLLEAERAMNELPNSFDDAIKVARSEMEYHASLKRKYETAAARPWMSVPPDPKASGVDPATIVQEAMGKMVSEVLARPTPPQLEIVEPASPGGK